MPGRVARSTRSSAISTKSGIHAQKSTARNSSPTLPDIPDEGVDTRLRETICSAFSAAQKSIAVHRKLCFALRKVQEECCYVPANPKNSRKSQDDDFQEEDFNHEFVRCVLRILPVKKAEAVGDRTIRFIGTFLNDASNKDIEIAQQDDPDTTSMPETPTSRLTTHILQELLPKLGAKDKTIRFRATQITSHIINSLDTLDDAMFHQLRFGLLKRIHDKEAMVRLQAVYGLGRLATEVEDDENDNDSDSDNDVGTGVLEKLLNVLQNDPGPEVRRNLLLNLPLTKEVLPYLLERARDADASTRRALYARLLPALGDFRHLSLTHREKLLRWGLRDRDENVRKATARLFRERWIEDCAALPAAQAAEQADGGDESAAQKSANEAAAPSLDALLELLERIDVVNSGIEGGVALTAMQEFWAGRPDYLDYVSFPDDFWEDLNPELAFVARTFNDFCRKGDKDAAQYTSHRDLNAMAEEKLPEVTKFGFFLEREMKKLIELLQATALGQDEDAEEDSAQKEFVVEQLLHMALTFDYSDEVGRRKMFVLMREALASPDIPEETTRLVVEVLRLVCGEDTKGEREFCGVVLEAIAEVHDTILGEEAEDSSSNIEASFHSATEMIDEDDLDAAMTTGGSQVRLRKKKGELTEEEEAAEEEKAIKEMMVNMKCLHIALCMLQNVGGDLEADPNLVTMLNNLVVPAARSHEAPIRERGLLCLGLCCLLGKNLAQENLTLFLHCFAKGHPALQVIALQVISDILITHPSLLSADAEQSEDAQVRRLVLKAFQKSLKSDDPAVQSTGATALSKVMLSRLIANEDLLKQLVIAYFDPDTNNNAHLRQSLSYFLPVYCHSRAENAKLMAQIAVPVITKLSTLRDALLDDLDVDDETAETMVKLSVAGQMLLDWTDPRKVVGALAEAASTAGLANGASETHFILAEHVLDRLTGPAKAGQLEKEERKVLFSMLGKLHLPAGGCDGDLLSRILTLVQECFEMKVAVDATSRNVLSKLRDALLKMMNSVTTAERGGGGAEETVVETTEIQAGAVEDLDDEEAGEDEEDDVNSLRKSIRDTTLGAMTIGVPDAEGTRVVLGVEEDSEMMDVDGEEYTTTEV